MGQCSVAVTAGLQSADISQDLRRMAVALQSCGPLLVSHESRMLEAAN